MRNCKDCIGYGICPLNYTTIRMEGHVPKIIEEGFADLCEHYTERINWEEMYKKWKTKDTTE
jgi:hypothetical protein